MRLTVCQFVEMETETMGLNAAIDQQVLLLFSGRMTFAFATVKLRESTQCCYLFDYDS